ncbi:hypothetical protein OQA88_9582 [Cercophora sp. LCS_1]
MDPKQPTKMPQDPNLYGQPPPKKQKKEIPISGSLAFASQLSSLVAAQTTAPSSTRPRPSKNQATELSAVKVKRNDARKPAPSTKLSLKSPLGTEDEKATLAHARRKMEAKARLYASMQRGDYVGRENSLVDFDRKWAEAQDQTHPDLHSSSSDEDSDNVDTEIVEWEDEFGRLRGGTRAEKIRYERHIARGQASAAELERMSARPKAPENLIVGDTVQAEAFVARDEAAMEALARKRDRSATPPEAEHYRADKEIRTKGVGFYQFSKDEETRQKEMAALEAERKRTEELRKEKEDKMATRKSEIEARRKQIEERRRVMEEKRAKKLADSFLDGLGKDLVDRT